MLIQYSTDMYIQKKQDVQADDTFCTHLKMSSIEYIQFSVYLRYVILKDPIKITVSSN